MTAATASVLLFVQLRDWGSGAERKRAHSRGEMSLQAKRTARVCRETYDDNMSGFAV
jgi:hypothetical protein